MGLGKGFDRGEVSFGGEWAVEGFRIIEEAVRSGLRFRAVLFSELAQARTSRLLPQIGAHVETLLLPDKLFRSVVPSETPQGVAALVSVKKFSLQDILDHAAPGPLLVIAGVQDPGNLETLLRSAEAFGATAILLGDGRVSVYNTKEVRPPAASAFRLKVPTVPL